MLKYKTCVRSITTDGPCGQGWKSPQMWPLVSSRWKTTGRTCDSSSCFSKIPPLWVNRLYSEGQSGVTQSPVTVWLYGFVLECLRVPGVITVPAPSCWTPSLDLPAMTGELEQGPKLAWIQLCSSTSGKSRVVLWGPWTETVQSQQGSLVFVGKVVAV